MRTLILDNGSHTIKAGFSDSDHPILVPNTVTRAKRTKRVFVADLIDKSSDLSGLYYRSPFDRGYLVHWDAELAIWDRMLSNDVLGCQPADTNLTLTEPVFNFPRVQQSMDEIVFEEYCFRSLIRAPAPKFSALNAGYTIYGNANPECVVVVDIGHTCTYVVPYHQGQMIPQCVRRVDVGGRMLTSYLKETVSFRYWDMMDETYIINAVKEKCCFVSQDFYRDLEIARKGRQSMLGVDYVLPDFTNSKKGFIRGQEPDVESRMSDIQILPLCNERFAVPEALFHPMDVGLDQGGIHLAVVQAIMACEERLRPVMFSNIILVGGSSQLPGLQERLQTEIQALAPADGAAVVVTLPDDPPAENAWLGARAVDIRESQDTDGSAVAASGVVDAPAGWRISREAYQENGPDRTISHFKRFI